MTKELLLKAWIGCNKINGLSSSINLVKSLVLLENGGFEIIISHDSFKL